MGEMFRLDAADADQHNPYRPRPTRRAPGNVPYIVDNLWEWRRPHKMPSRRHCVCVSPHPELAARAGGTPGGRVFRVEVSGARMAQIPQYDAREHPDVVGERSLARFILRLLGQDWLDGPAETKMPEALLWTPCLAQAEVEKVFISERLVSVRDNVWDAIHFWNDARPIMPGSEWPFPDGEIFFEAKSWMLLPTDPA